VFWVTAGVACKKHRGAFNVDIAQRITTCLHKCGWDDYCGGYGSGQGNPWCFAVAG